MPLDLSQISGVDPTSLGDEIADALRETSYLAAPEKWKYMQPSPRQAPIAGAGAMGASPAWTQGPPAPTGDYLRLDGSRLASVAGRLFECSPSEMEKVSKILTKAYGRAMRGELKKATEAMLGNINPVAAIADERSVLDLQEESLREGLQDVPELLESGLEITYPDAPIEQDVLGVRKASLEEVKVRNLQRREKHMAQPGNDPRQGVVGLTVGASVTTNNPVPSHGTVPPPATKGGGTSSS